MQKSILFITVLIASHAQGQSAVLSSGTMHLMEGTTLRFDSPLVLTLQPGATIVNDGVIDLGSEARLIESTGEPIRGTGVETARVEGSGPFTALMPGGLGLTLTTTANGPIDITRGHLAQLFPEGDAGIERWYRMEAPNAGGVTAEVQLHYDETELNGLAPSSLALFTAPVDAGPWTPAPGMNNATSFTISGTLTAPWSYITAFDADAPTSSPTLFATASLQVWPTLTEGPLFIHATDGDPLGSLEVFDGLGRSVATSTEWRSATLASMDLSTLTSGPYFLRIGQRITIKLRKE